MIQKLKITPQKLSSIIAEHLADMNPSLADATYQCDYKVHQGQEPDWDDVRDTTEYVPPGLLGVEVSIELPDIKVHI